MGSLVIRAQVVCMNKIKGTIIGQAIGDALGFPVEGSSPERCSTYLNQWGQSTIERVSNRGFQFGQFTDDTQLALALLQSLVNSKGWNRRGYADRIAELFHQNLIVGRGIATDAAATKIINGVDLDKTATPAPSAGNGTAMRAAPVGMYFDDINTIIEVARQQGQLTHADPRCDAGSVIIALSVYYLRKLDGHHALDVNEYLDLLIDHTKPVSELFAKSLVQLKGILDLDPIGAARMISTWGDPDFLDGWKYISPYVIPSVCWSVWSFITNPHSFEDAISTAIRPGGDVDTTAAMTGALSGAFLGFDQLPDKMITLVHDRDRWDHTSILALCDKLDTSGE